MTGTYQLGTPSVTRWSSFQSTCKARRQAIPFNPGESLAALQRSHTGPTSTGAWKESRDAEPWSSREADRARGSSSHT